MDTNQTEKLKALALAYMNENNGHWYGTFQIADGISYEPAANFIYECTPAAVLELIAAIPESESVPIPTTVNMARMMVALGCNYLKENAPEHLIGTARAAGTDKDAERAKVLDRPLYSTRQDAARYRWLTESPGFIRPHLNGQAVYVNWSGTKQALDAAIDAAIAAHTKAGEQT